MDLLLTVAVGAAVAGFVQGLTGFGFGLTAMALWAWLLEPRLAAALAVFGGLSGQLLAVFTVRRGLHLRDVLPFIAGGLLGLPLGLWLLPQLDVPLFKAVLGGMFVVVCPLMMAAPRLPQLGGGRAGDALAGAAGGVMGGLGGFTGIVPTLWCTVRGFAKDRQRAVIQNFNLAMLSVTFASYLATGIVQAAMLPLLAVVAVAVVLPVLLGVKVYVGLSEAAFRTLVLVVLGLSGLALLVASVPVLLAR